MLMRFMLFLIGSLVFAAHAQDKPGLTNESALGYVITGGNSQSETTSFKQKTVYAWTSDILKIDGHYLQSEGQDPVTGNTIQNAENWSATLRFERVITPNVFNAYLAHGWYGDRFQNVSEGHNTDIGGKYFWMTSESLKLFSELGYRYTRELLIVAPLTPDARVGVGSLTHPEFHYIRAFSQIDYAHSKTFSVGAWIEYLPSITSFKDDQRLNYSPYLTSVLTDMFSLKVAYEGRYRFKPAQVGNKLTDYTFTTSLIAKF